MLFAQLDVHCVLSPNVIRSTMILYQNMFSLGFGLNFTNINETRENAFIETFLNAIRTYLFKNEFIRSELKYKFYKEDFTLYET